MKKLLYSALSIIAIGALGTACSKADSQKSASKEEAKLTAEQVLAKAEQKATATEKTGQKWETGMEMDMKLPEGKKADPAMPESINVKMTAVLESIGPDKSYTKAKISGGGGPITMNMEMDMFLLNKELYVKQNLTNEWIKGKFDTQQGLPKLFDLPSADEQSIAKSITKLKENVGQLKFQEEGDSYRFTAEANDAAQVEKLLNLLSTDQKMEKFNQKDGKLEKLTYALVVDKKSFQVKELSLNLSGSSVIEKENVQMSMKVSTKHLGEVKDITPLPEEAKKAKEMNPVELKKMLDKMSQLH